jgi:hypothetical protein
MKTLTKKQINDIDSKDKLSSAFWGFEPPKVAKKDQKLILDKAIEYNSFFPLDDMAKSNTLTNEVLDAIVKQPNLIKMVIMQSGFPLVIKQMSDKQIFKLIDGLDSLDKPFIWTHFYQKTLNHAFRNDAKRTLTILQYLIVDKEISKFLYSQTISNIITPMYDSITTDFIDWIKVNTKNHSKVIGQLLQKKGKLMDESILEYIYFNLPSSSNVTIAVIMLEISPNSIVLGDYYHKTGELRYLPKEAKEVFLF